jgi:hypothetical protein
MSQWVILSHAFSFEPHRSNGRFKRPQQSIEATKFSEGMREKSRKVKDRHGREKDVKIM